MVQWNLTIGFQLSAFSLELMNLCNLWIDFDPTALSYELNVLFNDPNHLNANNEPNEPNDLTKPKRINESTI